MPFITKELVELFEGQLTFSGDYIEKYISFSVQIEKEVKKNSKNEKEMTKIISYRLQFIDSARIMTSSLLNLVNNLPEGFHKIKCKYRHDDKKWEPCGIKYKYWECCLEIH